MPPTLEEVIYDLARAALDEQRDLVANLRSRAAPVLAGAGALAALLARPAIGEGLSFRAHPGHAALVCIGIAGAVIALLGAILVLAPVTSGSASMPSTFTTPPTPTAKSPTSTCSASPSRTGCVACRTEATSARCSAIWSEV